MIVLVCGSRDWTDDAVIRAWLSALPAGTVIMHGDNGNRERTIGADRIADRIAEELGLPRDPHPAHWCHDEKKCPTGCAEVTGKPAGPIRNRKMLDRCPDRVLAFHWNLDASRGTRDCVMEAKRRGIPYQIVRRHQTVPAGAR